MPARLKRGRLSISLIMSSAGGLARLGSASFDHVAYESGSSYRDDPVSRQRGGANVEVPTFGKAWTRALQWHPLRRRHPPVVEILGLENRPHPCAKTPTHAMY